jgi:beta-glucosidase
MLTLNQLQDFIEQMTLEEKIGMLHGEGIFQTKGVPRLQIPPLKMSDGPMGVRQEFQKESWVSKGWEDDYVTYFPSNTALAATWNVQLAHDFGLALGAETRSRGKDIILAPGINLIRTPLCGRNFEYMSEDPYLTRIMGKEIVTGIQKNDVAACVKHFAANNQETNRMTVDARISDSALEELYLPAFYDTLVQADAYTVMGAYNKLNGDYCCESSYLLDTLLRQRWHYDGVSISDWGGVHSTVKAALAGLDIEMNVTSDFENYYFSNALKDAVNRGDVPMTVIDDKIMRILKLMNKLHMFEETRLNGSRNTPAHQHITLAIARESIVLLENKDSFLPLNAKQLKKILVVGENAIKHHAQGGGSAQIKALYEHTPFTGISMFLGGNVTLDYISGYTSDTNASPSRHWELREEAKRAAGNYDVILFIGGLNHDFDTEGSDRADIELPYEQNALLEAIASVNPKIVSVNISGSAVNLTTLKRHSKALVQTWYNGMEGGRALAEVLFGAVSPCGKMPFTISENLSDYSPHSIGEFPGDTAVHYTEGLFIGYRHFDTHSIKPLFAFGHGLSYTHFEYSDLAVEVAETITVTFTLKNTGELTGKETAQVYIQHLEPIGIRPHKELKSHVKIELTPGSSKRVNLSLTRLDFSYYNPNEKAWVLEPGKFNIIIGASSTDCRLEHTLSIS